MNAKRTWITLNALLVAILACNLPANQSPAQPPDLAGTITAQAMILLQTSNTPTFTPMPALTETPTLTPTATLPPTPTVPEVSVTSATNCRTGPGLVYDLVFTLQPGQTVQLVGKYTPLNYWIINKPGGGTCWLWGQYAVVSGNVAVLPDYPPPPTPTLALPAAPSGLSISFHCAISNVGFIHNNVHAELGWQDNASNESGYYLYRNGDLLATLGPDENTYSDDTTMAALALANQPVPQITYAVQAFNDAGKSKKISKSISCFH